MHEVTALTEELVTIASHEDPTAAGDRIEAWLRSETDAAVDRDEVGNVIAHRGEGDRTLALVGHHDVVPPAEEQVAPDGSVVAEIDDGRLFGRGSADMKGAVAAMMLAFRDAEPGSELAFASFVGEEIGGIGAQHAVAEGFVPDYAVIGEGSAGYAGPGGLDVVTMHRGRRGSTLVAEGIAAHASEPEAGTNAIYLAIEAIDRLRRLERPSIEVHGERLDGTLEVTELEAGTAMNVIPDRCTVTLDERTLPGEALRIAETVDGLKGITWEIDQDWPPMRCSDADFAATTRKAIGAAQERAAQLVTKPHATDASWLARAGTATVVIGPAERGEAHTSDESVSLDLLEVAAEGYRNVAESIAE